jgi:hypothetical protein
LRGAILGALAAARAFERAPPTRLPIASGIRLGVGDRRPRLIDLAQETAGLFGLDPALLLRASDQRLAVGHAAVVALPCSRRSPRPAPPRPR